MAWELMRRTRRMGLGKTLQTLSLLAYLNEQHGVKGPHLLICPLSVLGAWITVRFCFARATRLQITRLTFCYWQEINRWLPSFVRFSSIPHSFAADLTTPTAERHPLPRSYD